MPTAISWTNETWNPVTGCSRVSEGCRNCYAERLSLKYGWSHKPWTNQNAAENVKLHQDRLGKPYSWTKPRMVFVNSMSDLFHELVPDWFLRKVFQTMADNKQHTFQILTKRPAAAVTWNWWPDNVWIGTSIEDERVVDRISILKQCIARTKFISFEPLIGPVGQVALDGISWVIVGGESGPGFRPMDMAWAREIRDLCADQRVAFFFKQDASLTSGARPYLVEADGSKVEYKQYPGEYPVKPGIAEQTRLF